MISKIILRPASSEDDEEGAAGADGSSEVDFWGSGWEEEDWLTGSGTVKGKQ